MSIAERSIGHDVAISSERDQILTGEHDYKRTGVILVLASLDYRDRVKVCMIRHLANPLKGISYGDLGLPSETLEKKTDIERGEDPLEDPTQALLRCFREEVGIEDLSQHQFFADPEASDVHLFNLDTGLNGDSSNALGHVAVIWAPDQTRIIRSFQQAQTRGVIDKTEVAGMGFYDLDEIINPSSSLQFRRAPHAPTVITQLHQKGKLQSPI